MAPPAILKQRSGRTPIVLKQRGGRSPMFTLEADLWLKKLA
jgi:hypothetical protein